MHSMHGNAWFHSPSGFRRIMDLWKMGLWRVASHPLPGVTLQFICWLDGHVAEDWNPSGSSRRSTPYGSGTCKSRESQQLLPCSRNICTKASHQWEPDDALQMCTPCPDYLITDVVGSPTALKNCIRRYLKCSHRHHTSLAFNRMQFAVCYACFTQLQP